MPQNSHNITPDNLLSILQQQGFFERLVQQGFDIGIDTYLRVEQLLRQWPTAYNRQDLKEALCSIIATNDKQQTIFYQLFDEHFGLINRYIDEKKILPDNLSQPGQFKSGQIKPPPKSKIWPKLLTVLGLIGLLFLLCVLAIKRDWYYYYAISKPESIPDSVNYDSNLIRAKTGMLHCDTLPARFTYQITDSLKAEFTPVFDTTRHVLSLLWDFNNRDKDSQNINNEGDFVNIHNVKSPKKEERIYAEYGIYKTCLTVKYQACRDKTYCQNVQIEPPQLPTLTFTPLNTAKLPPAIPWQKRVAITLLILAGITALSTILIERNKWRKRRLLVEKGRDLQVSAAKTLHIPHNIKPYQKDETFYALARIMRQRRLSEGALLDIPKTISSTVKAAGLFEPKFKPNTQPTEYLVLIDRHSYKDHLAHLYKQWVLALKSENVYIDYFFYNKDPRLCWPPEQTNDLRLKQKGIFLHELNLKYPQHRLIIIGNAHHLLNPETGRPEEWVNLLQRWPERILISPQERWMWREKQLAQLFVLHDATFESLTLAIEQIQLGKPNEHINNAFWQQKMSPEKSAPQVDDYNTPNQLIAALQRYLGPELFELLCACAVYPEMYWDLTLLLAQKDSPALSPTAAPQTMLITAALPNKAVNNLIKEENLRHLFQISWFKTGIIPDNIREVLIQYLSEDARYAINNKIIAAISAQLDKSDGQNLPAGVERDRLIELVSCQIQNNALEDASLKRLKDAIIREGSEVKWVEPNDAATHRLYVELPTRLRRLFINFNPYKTPLNEVFKAIGYPTLRRWVAETTTVVALFIAFGMLLLWANKTTFADNLKATVLVETSKDSLNNIENKFLVNFHGKITRFENGKAVIEIPKDQKKQPYKVFFNYTDAEMTYGIDTTLVLSEDIRLKIKQHRAINLPCGMVQITGIDPYFNKQWYLYNNGKGYDKLNQKMFKKYADAHVLEAWNCAMSNQGSPHIRVALIANGSPWQQHPEWNDQADKFVAPYKQSNNSNQIIGTENAFATELASLIAAPANGRGMVGVAPNARIMPIVLDYISDQMLKRSLQHAIDSSADIIVFPMGKSGISRLTTSESAAIHNVVLAGRNRRGIVMIVAAGNTSKEITGFAAHPDVICVTPVNSTDNRSAYSDYGPNVWISAPSNGDPGAGILAATYPDNSGNNVYYQGGPTEESKDYYTDNAGGTGVSAAIVGGVCALMLSVNPDLTAQDIKEILARTADKIPHEKGYDANGHSLFVGYGRINAFKAVQMAASYTPGLPNVLPPAPPVSSPPAKSPKNCGKHGRYDSRTDRCNCLDGYTGQNCQTPPDLCTGINCGLHGTCNSVTGRCDCKDGYTGARCQTPPDPCLNVDCGKHGECDRQTGRCNCFDGYTGSRCQNPPPDPCLDVNCGRHGVCSSYYNQTDKMYRAKCNCKDGYSGEKCQNPPQQDPINEEKTYEQQRPFQEGFAAVAKNIAGKGYKWGFIDEKGTLVVPIMYDNVSDFIKGEAQVEKDGYIYYIDYAGKCVRNCIGTSTKKGKSGY